MSPKLDSLLPVLKKHDSNTYFHCLNVKHLTSLIIDEYLKTAENNANRDLYYSFLKTNKVSICKAALYHDIGKIYVPLKILGSTKSLSKRELNTIKQHPFWGKIICSQYTNDEIVLQGIYQHHERLTGSGYPKKTKKICIAARLITIADVFDALHQKRSYKESWSSCDVLKYLNANQKDFDPIFYNFFISEPVQAKVREMYRNLKK